jgi:16S rRNA (cytosine1402-N4)-methyltransferase
MKNFIFADGLGFTKPGEFWPGAGLFSVNKVVRWARKWMEWTQVGIWPWFGVSEPSGGLGFGGDRSQFDPGSSAGDGADPEPEDAQDHRSLPFYHEPVLLQEVVDALAPKPGKLFFDGTLGGGGHSGALLEHGAHVVGMDQDANAIRYASERLSIHEDRFCALRGNFRHFPEILAETQVTGFDGMLIDLGVSSHQLDEPTRGFSFMNDGPLDLRMDADSGRPASDLINTASQEELERILRDFGEEPQFRRIARAIVKARQSKPIQTTSELAGIIESAIGRKGKRHPATLAFQALRIAVNDELAALHQFLEVAPRWLKPGGILAVISFHSLEDRIVKQAFHHLSAAFLDRPEWPEPRKNPDFCLKRNPRARSARLRVAQKVSHES